MRVGMARPAEGGMSVKQRINLLLYWAKHGFKGRVYVCRNCGRITWRNTKVSIQPKDKNVCAFCAFESKE